MDSDTNKSAVAYMSRHFVALACDYESLNDDGSVFHRGTLVVSGFLIELYGRVFWGTAGHCLKDELDKRIDEGQIRVVGGGFMDYFGHEATHFHMVPFTYEAHCAWYVEEPEVGMDFALLLLNELDVAAFLKNKLIPVTRDNWVHQANLTFDFYRMLGIPKDEVNPGKGHGDVLVRQAMVAINRVSSDEAGDPPPDAEVPSDAWFVGRIDSEAPIKNIKGMSGGPIYGFRKDAAGNLLYHVVALQSRWWDQSRTIFGCSVPAFAEAVYRQIDEFAQQCKEHEQMIAPPNPYEQKFADFIRMLAESPEEVIVIHHPQVIGDAYDEIVESLNRLADARKHLVIVPRRERN
jgi:hypothetical protein